MTKNNITYTQLYEPHNLAKISFVTFTRQLLMTRVSPVLDRGGQPIQGCTVPHLEILPSSRGVESLK